MDDLFGMLLNGLSPSRQLAAALTSGMTDTVKTLIDSGGTTLVNEVLQQQSGRTALHIACQANQYACIDWLVEAGAQPDIKDFFGMTPLELALRSGHEKCVQKMLSLNSGIDPLNLWTAQTRAGTQAWRGFSKEVIAILIIATPNFSQSDASRVLRTEYFQSPAENEGLIQAYLLTGNKLNAMETSSLLARCSPELGAFVTSLQRFVPSLQHICRLKIRHCMRTNVIYGAKTLPLPYSLQSFIVSSVR